MATECEWPTCRETATAGPYCFNHHRVYGTKVAKPPPQPIAKKSEKMKVEDKEYKKFKTEYLAKPENKYCRIQGPHCTKLATCINHLKRRFKNTKMNEEFVEASCFNCNSDIENHDAEARATGHLLSKFN